MENAFQHAFSRAVLCDRALCDQRITVQSSQQYDQFSCVYNTNVTYIMIGVMSSSLVIAETFVKIA